MDTIEKQGKQSILEEAQKPEVVVAEHVPSNLKNNLTSYMMPFDEAENNHDDLDEFLGPNSELGTQLRAFYTSIQEEKIPEKFLILLSQLEEAEKQQDKLQVSGKEKKE